MSDLALIEQDARRIHAVVRGGGLALVPTLAGYGLIGMRAEAVARIYALKGRPASKPCVTVATWPIFDAVTSQVDARDRAWAKVVSAHLPLALVTPIAESSGPIRRWDPAVRAQCTQDGTIATFHNAGALLCAVATLAFADGELLVGSSANRSGTGNNHTLDEVPPEMCAAADAIVDGGRTPFADLGRMATTIVDLSTGRFVRAGLHYDTIRASWDRRTDGAGVAVTL